MLDILQQVQTIEVVVFTVMLQFWWLLAFLVLSFAAPSFWLTYVQTYYKKNNAYMLIELHLPREVKRSPRAMEQVFTAIHGIKNSPSNFEEKWWQGEVPLWFSCEIASFGGEVHFYMQIPAKHRNMIEAALYAHYPDIEVSEVKEDYIYRMPPTWPELEARGYNIFGNELILDRKKGDVYPIRTYEDFEEQVEEKQLDPISSVLETLVKIKPQEQLWLQIIIRPLVDDTWKKKGEQVMKDLKEKVGRRTVQTAFGEYVAIDRSPGEVETMKAIDKKLEKPGFQTLIRYIYIAPRGIFNANFGQRGLFTAMNQYMSESLNKFGHNVKAWTRASFWYWPYFFPQKRAAARKERIYANYRARKMYGETTLSAVFEVKFFHFGLAAREWGQFVMTNAELATIYHIPTFAVLTGPIVKRVEARKVGPPAGLPIYGQEGEEEKLPGMK